MIIYKKYYLDFVSLFKKLLKYNTNDFSEVFGWNSDNVNSFFKKYYLNALKEIEPKFNVKEMLTNLRKEGHKIIFITIRNDKECAEKNEAYRITSEWLNKYEIPYDELQLKKLLLKIEILK